MSEWPVASGSGVNGGSGNAILTSGEADCVDKAVRDLLGPDQRVLSVEKKQVVVQESEVVMVNGNPITLTGQEGERIKACLLSGNLMEYPQLLNQLLQKAGLLITSETVTGETDVRSRMTSVQTAKVNDQDQNHRLHEATECYSLSDCKEMRWKASDPPSKPTPSTQTPPLVVADDEAVVSGTLEELINELVPRAHSLPSEDFQFAFLLG